MRGPQLEVRQWWGDSLLEVRLYDAHEQRVTVGMGGDFLLPEERAELLVQVAGTWRVRAPEDWQSAEQRVGRQTVWLSREAFRFEATLVDAQERVAPASPDLMAPLLVAWLCMLLVALWLGLGLGRPGLGGSSERDSEEVVEIPTGPRLQEVTLLLDVTPPDARSGSLHKSLGAKGPSGKRSGERSSERREVTRNSKEEAMSAGLLGALADPSMSQLGRAGLSDRLTQSSGSLFNVTGYGVAAGTGLGARGQGLGAEGTIETLEMQGKTACAGHPDRCAGSFGAKGEGGIGVVGGDPVLLGALDRGVIDEVIKRHMNQIRYCYQRSLQTHGGDMELAGKLVIKFTIAKDGTVSAARATSEQLEEIESCVVSRFLRMQFPVPKGGGIVVVSYPFLFQAS